MTVRVYLLAAVMASSAALAEPPAIIGLPVPPGATVTPALRTAMTDTQGRTVAYLTGNTVNVWTVSGGPHTMTVPPFTPTTLTGQTPYALYTRPLELAALTPDGAAIFVNQIWTDAPDNPFTGWAYYGPWRWSLDGGGAPIAPASKVLAPPNNHGAASTEADFVFSSYRLRAVLNGGAIQAGLTQGFWAAESDQLAQRFASPFVCNGSQTVSLGYFGPGQFDYVDPRVLALTVRGLEIGATEDLSLGEEASVPQYVALVAGGPARVALQFSFATPFPETDFVAQSVQDMTPDGRMVAGVTVHTGGTTEYSAVLWPRAADGAPLTPIVLDTARCQETRVDDAARVAVYQRFVAGPTEDILVRYLTTGGGGRLQDVLTAQGVAAGAGWTFSSLQDLSGDGRVIVGTGRYQGGPVQVFRAVIGAPCNKADLGATGGIAMPDGVRDNNDFVVYIDLFFANNPVADMGVQGGIAGSDGLFDNNDFVVFINAFFAPCEG